MGRVSEVPGLGINHTRTCLRRGGNSPRNSTACRMLDSALAAGSDVCANVRGCIPSLADVFPEKVRAAVHISLGVRGDSIGAAGHTNKSESSSFVPQ